LKKKLLPFDDSKELSKILIDKFGWEPDDSKKIWFWEGTNCVVDLSKSVSYLNEVKDSIKSGFEWVVKEGGLCGEPLRGVRFNIMNAELHPDAIHRGQSQMLLPARNVFLAAQLSAQPCLYEPVYMVEIQTDRESVSKIYGLFATRRGLVFEESYKDGTPFVYVKAYLPVIESFGFVANLLETTSGRAFPQMLFSHFQPVQGDIHRGEYGDLSTILIHSVRARKGLPVTVPTFQDYHTKL